MASLKTVILCGGKGTRAYPHTTEVPKPLLEVAGRPILQHVMEIYASQGFTAFVLSAGFKAEMVREFASTMPGSWDIDVVDTGEDTNTGGRVIGVRDRAGETFFATYSDGLGDVDLGALLAFHRGHAGSATLTTVPLPSQYGTIDHAADGRVEHFREKPTLRDHWINGGFFVFDQAVFDRWEGEDLEREVLPVLGEAGELYAYRHDGFWKSMDTYKDAVDLTALATEGRIPWARSKAPASS
ncbi:MAG: sugar phosphate nucleotidyltransferase [Actinomycetota bacterium]